ncbi:hypothetical protein E3P92_03365 [Wallemia ichthyophaga]|nr:hypothetical protein E3P92_03365 [Wallemia ichthyophaga]
MHFISILCRPSSTSDSPNNKNSSFSRFFLSFRRRLRRFRRSRRASRGNQAEAEAKAEEEAYSQPHSPKHSPTHPTLHPIDLDFGDNLVFEIDKALSYTDSQRNLYFYPTPDPPPPSPSSSLSNSPPNHSFTHENPPSPVFKLINNIANSRRSYSPIPVSSDSILLSKKHQDNLNCQDTLGTQDTQDIQDIQGTQNMRNTQHAQNPPQEPPHLSRIWSSLSHNYASFTSNKSSLSPNKAIFIRETFNAFKNIDSVYSTCTQYNLHTKYRRQLLFDWVYALIDDLNTHQVAPERSACLDSLAVILERFVVYSIPTPSNPPNSKFLSPLSIAAHIPHDEHTVCNVLSDVIRYSLSKLNSRGVFQNTIFYCGRYFAIAFFRVPGVAYQLLQPLDVSSRILAKLVKDSGWCGASLASNFPDHLKPLTLTPIPTSHKTSAIEIACHEESKAYINALHSYSPSTSSSSYITLEPDNWLRRWTSDDSELFFSFVRAYHRLMHPMSGGHDKDGEGCESVGNCTTSTPTLFSLPGYAHLSYVLHSKMLSLLKGDIYSVTTGTTNSLKGGSNEVAETANVLAPTSGKPKLLDQANRRVVSTMQDLIQAGYVNVVDYHLMVAVHSTNLYSAPQVFCLLDALDGIIAGVYEQRSVDKLDLPFILHFLAIILKQCDHVLTLIRTISFIFTHFDSLCCTLETRRALCIDILLDQALFTRLTLFWSQSVRSYWLRLLVFRIGHVQGATESDDAFGGGSVRENENVKRFDDTALNHNGRNEVDRSSNKNNNKDNDEDKDKDCSHSNTLSQSHSLTLSILLTLNTLLNKIHRRHEQLEPDGVSEAEHEREHDSENEFKQENKRNSIIESSSDTRENGSESEIGNGGGKGGNTPPTTIRTPSAATGLGLEFDGASTSVHSPQLHEQLNQPTTPPRTPKKTFSFELQSPTSSSSSPSSSPQSGEKCEEVEKYEKGEKVDSEHSAIRVETNCGSSAEEETTRTAAAIHTAFLPEPAAKLLINTGNTFNTQTALSPTDSLAYDPSLHTYASKALNEYINILNVEYQYQDWQSKLVPRLTVQWPAAFTFD